MTERIEILRPDDWHAHFREGTMLRAVVPHTARHFARAIVMPNLVPPVTCAGRARAYREEILAAVPDGVGFEPLMTCYLTDGLDPSVMEDDIFVAAKLYPAHATTNSAHGVTDVARIAPVLERMQRLGKPLLVHGEVTDPDVDVFDREAVFVERILAGLRRNFPELPIVLEHVTTAEGAAFVAGAPGPTAATITPHHLVIDRNALFAGGIRPHLYCLPIAKRRRHRDALRAAAVSGSPRFFLGTDTAPHRTSDKESACGCAGVFCAPSALATYAEVFAEEGALDRLEAFASLNGPRFYGLPANRGRVTLERAAAPVPASIPFDGGMLVPFRAGEPAAWRVASGIVID